MHIPPALATGYLELLKRCVDASKQAQITVDELDELVETGFQGTEAARVQAMIDELQRIETNTDHLQIKLRASCFAIEKDMSPVDVIFLYRVIDWTGDLADAAQSAGDRVQLMLAR